MVLGRAGARVSRLPAGLHAARRVQDPRRLYPQGWDDTFVCPTCLSTAAGWTPAAAEDVVTAAPIKKAKRTAFQTRHPATQKDGDGEGRRPLTLKLYAAMAQTDCTACGYDCEGYAKALADGTEKDPNLCVPGKEETAIVVKNLLKGTGLPASFVA